MIYEKTTWQSGDLITSEKLNHLEDGVGAAFIAPPIEGTDVGKVLGVTQDAEENPVYGLVNTDQLFVVTLNMIEGKPPTYTSDKTNAEIYAAYTAGKVVVAKWEQSWLSPGKNIYENSATFFSLTLFSDATGASIQQFTIFSDTVTHVQGEIAVSPLSD